MSRELAASLVQICREADVSDLRVETAMGAHQIEAVEVWLENGVIHLSVTGDLPRCVI